MGNCFGKESGSSSTSTPARRNNFSSPGRTLGSAPPKAGTAAVPTTTTAARPPDSSGYENGPVATLAGGFGAPTSQTPLLHSQGDAKSAAAKAAEERAAKAAQGGHGALEQKLAAQRKQNALQQAAADNLRAREIDGVAEARNYN